MRQVKLFDILDLVACAEDYGHWNNVCMVSLYEWAKPVTDDDIKKYAECLTMEDGYGQEDRDEVTERLTKWRDKYETPGIQERKTNDKN